MTRRLDIGSGYYPHEVDDPEWEHLDINPSAPHVEHVHDLTGTDGLPFAMGTFAELRASDVLEHLPYTRTGRFLSDCARVLESGGRLTVVTPDAEEIMRRHLAFERDAARGLINVTEHNEWVPDHLAGLPLMVSTAWRLLGGHDDDRCARDGDDWRWNAHYALFSEDSLRWYLERAGFTSIDIMTNDHPNLIATAVTDALT